MNNKIAVVVCFLFSGLNVSYWVAFPNKESVWLNAGAAVICFGMGIATAIKGEL